MSKLDKTPLKSKKFIFACVSQVIIAGILVYALRSQDVGFALSLVMSILAIGLIIVPVGYVLGQSAVDKLATMVESVSNAVSRKSDDSN